MSRWLDRADALKTYLEGLPALDGIDIIVDRQKDVAALVANAIGKAKGACVTILWTGGTNPNPEAAELKMGGTFVVRIYSRPVVAEAAELAHSDELTETVAEALHGWSPTPNGPRAIQQRLRVMNVEMEPHKHLLVYAIECEATRLS